MLIVNANKWNYFHNGVSIFSIFESDPNKPVQKLSFIHHTNITFNPTAS